jgi:pyrroline-5-carboxylate reductase
MDTHKKLLILGAGKMGGSLLKGLIASNKLDFDISIIEPNLTNDIQKLINPNGIEYYKSPEDIKDPDFDLVIFAVKPQSINEVCAGLGKNLNQKKIFSIISILAGTKIKEFKSFFKESPVIRTMPNLAVSEGSGMTALCGSNNANKSFKATAGKIFLEVGEIIWVDNEAMMDVITATSGSGPAYFFFLAECLALISEEMGLSNQDAHKLSRQVVIGSADVMRNSTESLASLRKKVTSKGGTTEAALDVMMDSEKDFYNIFKKAIKAAFKRSNELSN